MVDINPLNQLYKDLMTIIENAEVKYKVEADKYETAESKQLADGYITAVLKQDTFNTYYRYDEDVIAEVCNITDMELINQYHYDRNSIPYSRRTPMLLKQRQKIIDDYVEQNNYYRMLTGLPDIEESVEDYIYLPDQYVQLLNADSKTPIHELTNAQITLLTSHGFIDEIKSKYPTKKYLKYLGNNKIDLVTARNSNNFALLKMPYGISESLWNSFVLLYDQSREYFMTCIYITEYRKIIDYYDNFMAMCIMVMAIQQVMARTMKNVISREFFDEYSVKLLFEIYGVPYNQYMDSTTKKQIVQSLNLLVQNKGTNKVLFDIASILGYDRLHIYKYYLMKCQKFDIDGFPVTYYTTDEITGEKVIDYKKTYDIYFQKVEFDENDAYKAVQNSSNRLPYGDIVESDPYWVQDAELEEELYQSEYNYIESKYMGTSITYRMSRLLFENVYLIKMIFDKKDEIPHITIDIPKISLHSTVTLFDAMCILCAMTCKQNNLRGEILTATSKIMHVIGFNFEKDYDTIRNEILKNEYLDDNLVNLFKDTEHLTVDGINNMYQNYLHLYDIIVEKLSTTNSLEVYEAYKKLYNSLYYTKENREMFNIGTIEEPVYAETFLDYVQYSNPDIYQFILDTNENNMYEFINHIVNKIKLIIPTLKYLGFFSDSSAVMEEMLLELIRFFKSYTTDMLNMDTIIILDLKPESMVRFIDKAFIDSNFSVKDNFELSYSDVLTYTSVLRYYSNLTIEEKIHFIHGFYEIFDTVKFFDKINTIYSNITVDSEINYVDVIDKMFISIEHKEIILFKELAELYTKMNISDNIKFEDFYTVIVTFIGKTHMTLYDGVNMLYVLIFSGDDLKLTDSYYYGISNIYLRTDIDMDDKVKLLLEKLCLNGKVDLTDALYPLVSLISSDISRLHDRCRYEITYELIDFNKLIDSLCTITTLDIMKDNLNLYSDLSIYINQLHDDVFNLRDFLFRISKIYDNENIKIHDTEVNKHINVYTSDNIHQYDDAGTYKILSHDEINKFRDSLFRISKIYDNENIKMKDTEVNKHSNMYTSDNIHQYDDIEPHKILSHDEINKFRDSLFRISKIYDNENIKIHDTEVNKHNNMYTSDNIHQYDDVGMNKTTSNNDIFKLTDSCKVTYI